MIVTWSIVNNEMDYIKDVINHHIDFVDGMYILDTGSIDGTLEYLKSLNNSKIIVEEYFEKYTPQYNKAWEKMSNPFPEVEVRNYAINRAKEILKPEWLIQLDGDEIFLPEVIDIIRSTNLSIIGHSTINPMEKLENHSIERRQNHIVYDPHARIWKSDFDVKYIRNPELKGAQYHCIPSYNGRHVYHCGNIRFVSNNIHFHLHWMYGKKVDLFFNKDRKEIAKIQKQNKLSNLVPSIFWQRRKEWLKS